MSKASEKQIGGNHYATLGEFQPWDVLQRWLTPEEYRGYQKGVAIAYLAREAQKGGDMDIRKAAHHLERLCETFEQPAVNVKAEEETDETPIPVGVLLGDLPTFHVQTPRVKAVELGLRIVHTLSINATTGLRSKEPTASFVVECCKRDDQSGFVVLAEFQVTPPVETGRQVRYIVNLPPVSEPVLQTIRVRPKNPGPWSEWVYGQESDFEKYERVIISLDYYRLIPDQSLTSGPLAPVDDVDETPAPPPLSPVRELEKQVQKLGLRSALNTTNWLHFDYPMSATLNTWRIVPGPKGEVFEALDENYVVRFVLRDDGMVITNAGITVAPPDVVFAVNELIEDRPSFSIPDSSVRAVALNYLVSGLAGIDLATGNQHGGEVSIVVEYSASGSSPAFLAEHKMSGKILQPHRVRRVVALPSTIQGDCTIHLRYSGDLRRNRTLANISLESFEPLYGDEPLTAGIPSNNNV